MGDRKRARDESTEEDLRKEEERTQRILDIMEIRINRMKEALARFSDLIITWGVPGTQPVLMAKAYKIGSRMMTMEMMASKLIPFAEFSDYLRYVNVAVVKDFDKFEEECIENSKQIIQDLIALYRGQVCLLALAQSSTHLDDTFLEKLLAENPVVGDTITERFKEFRTGPVYKKLQELAKQKQEACDDLLSKAEQPSQDHTLVESNPESAPPATES